MKSKMRKAKLKKHLKKKSNQIISNKQKISKTEVSQKHTKLAKKVARDNARKAKHVRKLQLLEANAEEDKEIKRLEKVLKLKKRKKSKNQDKADVKIPNVFVDDGLDYILDVIGRTSQNNSTSKNKLEAENATSPGKRKAISYNPENKKPRRLVDLLRERGEEVDSSNENNVSDNDDEDNSDVTSEISEIESSANSQDEEMSDDTQKPDEPDKPKIWEDIYGRLRDEKGNVVKNKIETYVPPAKRAEPKTEDAQKKMELSRIVNRLKGLLNRLSESNMQPISSQIEEMYMKHSRNDMNEALLSIISSLVITTIPTAMRLVMEQAMLVALLHANIGSEIGAYVLQSLAVKIDTLLKSGENYGEGKLCNNLLLFLAHLYNFKVTHSMLIFDILKLLVDSFQDKDIELIQLILKNVGFALRKDDPLKLKEIIHLIQAKAPSFISKDSSSRVQFMLDTLVAIRNNNMYKIPDYDPTIIEHMRKVLRNLTRTGSSVQELAISFEDLLKAEEKGRWWIVGSAWSERDIPEMQSTSSTNSFSSYTNNFSENILNLAKKQHMNTEIRKTIFCIIMTAEDYMDAFEKLLRLNLKKQQQTEIIHVLLHCSFHEKKFNPYYAVLAKKFCKFDKEFQWTLKRSIWDRFKELEKMKPYQRSNLASLLLHSFINDTLPLSVLKIIPFSEMNKTLESFLRKILLGILLHESKDICTKIFKSIAPAKTKFPVLREGLLWFMRLFLLRNPSAYDEEIFEKLTKRITVAENALDSGSSVSLICSTET